jgi:hypothetical protein
MRVQTKILARPLAWLPIVLLLACSHDAALDAIATQLVGAFDAGVPAAAGGGAEGRPAAPENPARVARTHNHARPTMEVVTASDLHVG